MGGRVLHGARRFGLVPMAVALLAIGCDDDGTGLDPESLAGVWIASEAVVTNLADETESQDLIELGAEFVLELEADGSVAFSFTLGTLSDEDLGTYSVDGNTIAMVLDGDPLAGTIEGDADAIRISLDEGVEWDFDDNGIDVPARLDAEFVRSGG